MVKKINHEQVKDNFIRLLTRNGPLSAKEGCQQLGISQPVFSRLIAGFPQDILIIGKARATQYAAKREIPHVGFQIPLFEIDEKGSALQLATLHSIQPRGFYVESKHSSFNDTFYDDLPYFLDDLRPSGFLGRLIPKQYPEINAPTDVGLWTADHCLYYLTKWGWDLIGSYILGEEAFQNYLKLIDKRTNFIPPKNRSSQYEKIADEVLKLGMVGSSAAGEQPKFLTTIKPNTPVLVKFTPPIGDPISKRRRDLLICEYIAHQILNESGVSAAQSNIVKGSKRYFLEIVRFDRTFQGRRGLITLNALNSEFVGSHGSWKQVSYGLMDQNQLDKSIHQKICWLDLFGQLIGNTDRHLGNISFFTKQTQIIDLAPVYDMLPMIYAPQHEQLVDVPFSPSLPGASDSDIWPTVWRGACQFWKRVASHKQIIEGFRLLAQKNLNQVESMKHLMTHLPLMKKY